MTTTRVLIALLAILPLAVAAGDARSQEALKAGDILTGELNAMRSRVKGKRVATYQLVSAPRRLPPPDGLCNLETGPETFQLVTTNDAQAAQLKGLIGKPIAIKVGEVRCADDVGQMSEAVVTQWTVTGKP